MISKIEGTVWDINEKFVTIGVMGIGFKIYTTSETREVFHKGKTVSIFTHLVVREDALDLYGFLVEEELNFFEMLISISGIGPKTALNVLNISTVSTLKRAISTNDTSHLTKVSGIGKKVAEKIVLELKDKVGSSDENDISLRDEIDAVEALKALGYSQRDAREALKKVEKNIVKTGDRIKEALKILGK
ncbi:MAG: Holliday junction branch migration protein RuvA [Candidatus Pacebacteria bacterium]|nr:Holliday junction branch migration protein RuvA [Candidatus Paceibacterota bacterium]